MTECQQASQKLSYFTYIKMDSPNKLVAMFPLS